MDSSRSALGTWTAQSHNWRGGGGGGGDHLRRLQRITELSQASITVLVTGRGGRGLSRIQFQQAADTGAATVTSMMLLFTLLANNRIYIHCFSPKKRIIATKIGKLK